LLGFETDSPKVRFNNGSTRAPDSGEVWTPQCSADLVARSQLAANSGMRTKGHRRPACRVNLNPGRWFGFRGWVTMEGWGQKRSVVLDLKWAIGWAVWGEIEKLAGSATGLVSGETRFQPMASLENRKPFLISKSF
jgi:hypothetical protein